LFSIVFRAPATAALAALSLWLLFAVFWGMIVPLATEIVAPVDPYDPRTQVAALNTAQGLNRLSPNLLFAETTLALLNPGTRALGPVFAFQLHGALLGAPLPAVQSFLLVWPQLTGLIAAMVVLFTLGYAAFQRQEIRA
jgi:ABC-2 type transport system permease protein